MVFFFSAISVVGVDLSDVFLQKIDSENLKHLVFHILFFRNITSWYDTPYIFQDNID